MLLYFIQTNKYFLLFIEKFESCEKFMLFWNQCSQSNIHWHFKSWIQFNIYFEFYVKFSVYERELAAVKISQDMEMKGKFLFFHPTLSIQFTITKKI